MLRSKIAMGFFWGLLALHVWPGIAALAHAQGSRKDDIVFNSRGMPLAGATVRVCSMPASGQPCTPLALIYSDVALTQALANPTTTDGLGNYFFYAAPGKYMIEISGPSITTRQIPNVVLPSDPTAPSFSSLSSTGAINAFSLNLTGNLTVNGNTTVAGSLASGTLNLTNQTTAPGAAGAGTVNLYTKTSDKRLYYKDDGGAEIGPIANTTGAQTNVVNSWTAQQNFDANIAHKGPNPWFDITRYGGVASTQSTTGSISSGTPTLTLASAIDFANGQGIVIYKAGAATALSTPTTVTVTPLQVSGGATTRAYQIACEDTTGGMTTSSASGSTTTSAAILGLQGTVSIASWARTAGSLVITTGSPHNITAGSPVSVVGADAGISGLLVATAVTATTLTISQATAPDNSAGAVGTVQGIAYNKVTWAPNGSAGTDPPSNLMRCWVYRQDGGAGSFNLVGVAQGKDGYYEDYGIGTLSPPPYVPTTAPASSQAGYLATTISSGGGTTTLTLAANAGTTATTQTVLHDNVPALNAAQVASLANGSRGGTVYVPHAGSNTPFLLNSAWVMPTNGLNGTKYLIAGDIRNTQPIILASGSVFEGLPSSGNINGFSGTFAKDLFGAITCNNISPTIAAYPCMYAPPTRTIVVLRRIILTPNLPQQIGLLTDHSLDGSGSTDFVFDTSYFLGSKYSQGVVLKGGFGYYFDRTGFATTGAGPDSPYALRITTENFSNVPGNAGIVYCNDCFFAGSGVEIDDIPRNGGQQGGNFQLVRTLYEGGQTPLLRINRSTFTGGFYLQNADVADFVGGNATPMVDVSGSANIQGFKIVASTVNNGNMPLIVGGGVLGLSIDASSGSGSGVGASAFSANLFGWQQFQGTPVLFSNSNAIGPLATPATPTNLTLGGGGTGSLPSGHTYYVALSALDADGVASVPAGETVISGFRQASGSTAANDSLVVNFSPVSGAQGYRAWVGDGSPSASFIKYFAQTTSPITITTTGNNLGPGGGASAPTFTNAGVWKLKSTGQIGLSGENFSASPRAEQNVFLPGALTSTWTGATWTLDRAVTITRVEVQAKTPPSGCTTNAVVRLTDGTTPVNVTISAAANSSGAVSQNYAAGAALTVGVTTAASGCTTSPADANVVVQYRMQ